MEREREILRDTPRGYRENKPGCGETNSFLLLNDINTKQYQSSTDTSVLIVIPTREPIRLFSEFEWPSQSNKSLYSSGDGLIGLTMM